MAEQEIKIDDCWNRIGVWAKGGRDCPKLKEVGHCINCEVFSTAGRKLLECEAPAGYMEQWAEFCSVEQNEINTQAGSVILFRIGDEWLGLETRLLDEVMSMRSIHSVPHRKSPILKGLVNVRGELQLCISIGRLLNITRGEIPGGGVVKGVYERMVVTSYQGIRFVFPVSEVRGVYRFDLGEMKEAPATAMNCSVHYLKGMLIWESNHVGIIDQELLFPALERGIL
jgi:chemotaxis-related protein WspD